MLRRRDSQQTGHKVIEKRSTLLGNVYVRAVVVYLAVRLIGVGMLALLATQTDQGLVDWLTAWDGAWYLALAEDGYHGIKDGLADARGEFEQNYTAYAFFPFYPAMVSMLAKLPFLGFESAALLINLPAGAFFACGLVRLARTLGYQQRVGLLLVALFAGAPMAISLSMAYTEALFMAFAVWSLVFVLERNWIGAGLCCVGAGSTRSTAIVLIAVVVLAALVSLRRGYRPGEALTGALIAPLGLLGYWAHVANQTGRLTGWFDVQKGWYSDVDFGQATWAWFKRVLVEGPSAMEVGAVLILVGAAVLVVIAALNRVPWPLVAYAVGFLVLVIASSGLHFAKPRFLLPAAIVLLLPVAIGLAKRHTPTMLAATLGIIALGSWYSAYSLVGWTSSM